MSENSTSAHNKTKSGKTTKGIKMQPVRSSSPQKGLRKDDFNDPVETVAVSAAAVDTVADVVGDGDGESSGFIMWVSVAGMVLSYLAIHANPGNDGVMIGVIIFISGYLVLLSGLFVLYLIIGGLVCLYKNLFDDGEIPYLYIFGGLGIGCLLAWIRSLIPGNVMRVIQMVSWVLMFVGPAIMIQSGANITGGLCVIVSIIWLILFIIGMSINFAADKVGNAIDRRLAAMEAANATHTKAVPTRSQATAADCVSSIESEQKTELLPEAASEASAEVSNIENADMRPKKKRMAILVVGGIVLLAGIGVATAHLLSPNPLGPMVRKGILAHPVENYAAEQLRSDIIRHYKRFQAGDEELSSYEYVPALFRLHVLLKQDISPLLPVVQEMVVAGANPNARLSGSPALFIAVEAGNTEAVRTILNAGADINIQDFAQQSVMHIAAKNDAPHIIDLLISIGADCNSKDAQSDTPLHIAIRNRHFNTAKLLIESGSDINASNCKGVTPLTLACDTEAEALIKLLVDKEADVNHRNHDGKHSLMIAAEKGNILIVNTLIESGTDMEKTDSEGRTAIFYSVNNSDLLRRFITAGASVRTKDREGKTLLSHAVSAGNEQSVRLLLTTEAKCDVNTPDTKGNTPIVHAVRNNDVEMTKFLMQCGAALKHPTPLIAIAAQENNEDMVRLLIDSGVDPTERFKRYGRRITALDCTTSDNVRTLLKDAGCIESISTAKAVELLERYKIVDVYADSEERVSYKFLPYGAGPYKDVTYDNSYRKASKDFMYNYRLYVDGQKKISDYDYVLQIYSLWDRNNSKHLPLECLLAFINEGCYISTPKEGLSSLHYASLYGHKEVVRALIAANAAINHSNSSCETPLMMAVKQGRTEIVKILISADAGVNIKGKNGNSPLHVAVRNRNLQLVNILIESKADVDAKDDNGHTPLHDAAQNGSMDMVKALLAGGANANVKTSGGATPLQLAANAGHSEVAQVLLTSGSKAQDVSLRSVATQDVSQVRMLLDAGADVNAGNPLFYAAEAGKEDIVKLLLDAGADVCYIHPQTKQSALSTAAQKGHIGIAKLIAATGRDNTSASLLWSILNRDLEICRLLLKAGASPNSKASVEWGFREKSFLCLAVERKNIDIVKALVQAGAKPDTESNGYDRELLLKAIQEEQTEIALLLIRTGMPLQRVEDSCKKSPELEMAIDKENVKVFTALIKRKAHIGITWGPPDESFLHYLVSEKKYAILKAYLDMGVQVNVKDRGGRTPLVNAVLRSDVTAVKLLLSKGASPHIVLPTTKFYPYTHSRDSVYSEDYSLLHAAAREGNAEVVKALLAAGANPRFARKKLNLSYGETSRYAYPHDDARGNEVREILLRAYKAGR